MKKLIALCLLLFTFPIFAQENAMPAYVLFRLIDSPTPGDPNTYGLGCPQQVSDMSLYGGKQILPKFGQLVILDASVDQIKNAYIEAWQKALDWEVVDSDLVTDTHQIRAFVRPELVSASGMNRITRDQVETFLNEWGASIDSIAPGEVYFTVNIFEAIKSNGFWGRDVQMFAWSEVPYYTGANGTHRVKVDYTGYVINANEYAGIVTNHGCTIAQNKPQQNYVIFDCPRDNVRNEFKADVKAKFDGQYAPYKWRLTQEGIDAIIAAGGQLEVTKAQAIPLLRHRLDD